MEMLINHPELTPSAFRFSYTHIYIHIDENRLTESFFPPVSLTHPAPPSCFRFRKHVHTAHIKRTHSFTLSVPLIRAVFVGGKISFPSGFLVFVFFFSLSLFMFANHPCTNPKLKAVQPTFFSYLCSFTQGAQLGYTSTVIKLVIFFWEGTK